MQQVRPKLLHQSVKFLRPFQDIGVLKGVADAFEVGLVVIV
jgi:hypothetical protein